MEKCIGNKTTLSTTIRRQPMPDKYNGDCYIISSMKCYNKDHAITTLEILGYTKENAEKHINGLLKEYFNERSII